MFCSHLAVRKRPDNASIHHHFYQTDQLKGKEYRTEIYDEDGNIMSKSISGYSSTDNGGYFTVQHADKAIPPSKHIEIRKLYK